MRRLGVAAAMAVALGGCSAQADIQTADAGVAIFHREVDAGRFDAIYAAAAPEMKATTRPAALAQLLGAVHRKLGGYASGARSTWNVNYGTAGKIVTLVYASRYARGEATEQFTFRVDGAASSLIRYNINSNALIVN